MATREETSKEIIANMDLSVNSNNRHIAPRSPHLSNTASPLLSALPNATDFFPRSIPFPSFLSTSNPSTNGPNSLGSASGGAGLGVGVSPPPSAPASYSSGGNFSGSSGNPRQIRGYPGFEEQFANSHGTPGSNGGYYNPTQRYAQGSPVPLSLQFGGSQSQSQLQPGEGNYACTFDTLDEPFGGITGAAASGGAGNGGGDNVLCLGWEGGVDVWKVGRGVLEQVGRLEGLGGGVKSAKVDFPHFFWENESSLIFLISNVFFLMLKHGFSPEDLDHWFACFTGLGLTGSFRFYQPHLEMTLMLPLDH